MRAPPAAGASIFSAGFPGAAREQPYGIKVFSPPQAELQAPILPVGFGVTPSVPVGAARGQPPGEQSPRGVSSNHRCHRALHSQHFDPLKINIFNMIASKRRRNPTRGSTRGSTRPFFGGGAHPQHPPGRLLCLGTAATLPARPFPHTPRHFFQLHFFHISPQISLCPAHPPHPPHTHPKQYV